MKKTRFELRRLYRTATDTAYVFINGERETLYCVKSNSDDEKSIFNDFLYEEWLIWGRDLFCRVILEETGVDVRKLADEWLIDDMYDSLVEYDDRFVEFDLNDNAEAWFGESHIVYDNIDIFRSWVTKLVADSNYYNVLNSKK